MKHLARGCMASGLITALALLLLAPVIAATITNSGWWLLLEPFSLGVAIALISYSTE